MKRIMVFFYLVPLLIIGNDLIAQKLWNIDECIEYALENNLGIASQSVTNETNREYLSQSRRNLLPYVNAGSGYGINYGKSVDPNTNTVTFNNFASNRYSIQGGITLFEGFVRNNRIAWSKFIYMSGLEEQKALEVEIAFDVMEEYYNTLYYEGLLDIVKEQRSASEINLRKVRKETEIGISAQTDILEIEARLAEEDLQVIRTENNLKASLIRLKRAMNYPIGDDLLLHGTDDQEPVVTSFFEEADTIYAMAVRHLPEVRAKELQLKAVEKSLAIARGSVYPTLSLSAGYNTGYYETNTDNQGNIIAFSEQFKNNVSQSLSLSLSIPVFNRWNNRSVIKISKLELEKQRIDLSEYKNQLYYEIELYCQDLSAITAEYLQAVKQSESNRLAYEVANKKLEQGLFNIIDLYSSKNLYSNARSEMLRTKLQYFLKRKTIGFYMGEPLFGPILSTEN